jgi:type 1 glutamine amidotransferase
LPGFTLHDSEVYLNHKLLEPRTVLLGLRYKDEKTGKVWMQEHAGWVRPAGKGWIVYLMAGHSAKDFENPVYSRLVINSVIWKP